jgi:photosystem II stability/assembly factor-like uncharacterized protein
MSDAPDRFDEQVRSLTQRLIKASEQDPTESLESRKSSVARTGAVLLATVAVVAGLILVGTNVLHIQLSNKPVTSHTPPPVATATPSAGPTPTTAPSPTIAPSGIAGLHMFTPTVGWAQRQSDGAILHTTHGVQTWTVTSPRIGSETVIAVAFVDADAARVLTAMTPPTGAMPVTAIQSWSTDDGGATWTKGGSFVDYAAGTLDFVDRNHGWFSITGLAATGSSAIFVYRTIDGGAHWTEVDRSFVSPVAGPTKIPSGCDKNPVSFISATTGWATAVCYGGNAFLYVTHDGGITWRYQSLGNRSSEYGYTTDSPQFVSGSVGFMVGYVGLPPAPRAMLFVTTNGGLSWTGWLTPDYYPEASDFIDAQNGWLLLSGPGSAAGTGTLWVTHDAGRTWTNLHATPNVDDGLNLDFLSEQMGWAFTSIPGGSPPAQGLLQTTDGGHTWTSVTVTISGH